MKLNYLITGGAGFIGSKIVDFLKNKKNTIFIIDDLSTPSSQRKNLPNNVKFIKVIVRIQRF